MQRISIIFILDLFIIIEKLFFLYDVTTLGLFPQFCKQMKIWVFFSFDFENIYVHKLLTLVFILDSKIYIN